MPVMSFLLARHAKALFLAMDHYFDPHLCSSHDPGAPQSQPIDDGDGDGPRPHPP
jgi:hypothetical protein